MEIPPPPEEGQEPVEIDEERKAKEFAMYSEFATSHKAMLEQIASNLQQFRGQQQELLGKEKPLWPYVMTPEQVE